MITVVAKTRDGWSGWVEEYSHELGDDALIVVGEGNKMWEIRGHPAPTEYAVLGLRVIGFGFGTVKYLWRKIA